MPSETPHEYACEDCDLLYHGIPVIAETGEVLCPACAVNRDELLDTDPYECDGDCTGYLWDDGWDGDPMRGDNDPIDEEEEE